MARSQVIKQKTTSKGYLVSNGRAYMATGFGNKGRVKLRDMGSARKKSNGGAGG